MTLDLKRVLLVWAAVLLSALVPMVVLSTVLRVLAWTLVSALLVAAWVWLGRHAARQVATMVFAAGEGLPPPSYRQPVLLVCGDGLQGLFGSQPVDQVAIRSAEHGCYLRVPELDQLPTMVSGLLAQRPQWRAQLSVMMVVNPEEHRDAAVLAARMWTFCYQLGLARRAGAGLPVILSSYVQAAQGAGPWFGWQGADASPGVFTAGHCLSLADWQRQGDLATGGERLGACVMLDAIGAWLAEHVLGHFSGLETRHGVGLPLAWAVTLVPSLPARVEGNLRQQWLRASTRLEDARPLQAGDGRLPFADPLLQVLPAHTDHRQGYRALKTAMWMFAAGALVAMSSSAWHNHLLERQVADDLSRFRLLAPGASPQREAVAAVLRDDSLRLDDHYRNGTPWSLGWGLYRGAALRGPVHEALRSHQWAPVAVAAADTPIAVRLDSLSLFATASAELKPGSTQVLINALMGIKARLGWLIVIAGHTDATGSEQHNLQLSRARAVAVRDWLQQMGGIDGSCFVVQGLGASQPLASNDTEIGRAANRRVDIRLVPEAGACAAPATAAGGN